MCGCRKRAAATAGGPGDGGPPAPRAPPPPRTVRTVVTRGVRTVAAPPPPPPPVIIDPSLWGPQLWFVLHTIAELAGSVAVFQRISRVVTTIAKGGLRCPECQAHFSAWVTAHPFPTGRLPRDQSVAVARQWVLDLHNNVNARRSAEVPEEGAAPVVAPAWSTEQVVATYASADRRALRRAAIDRLRQIQGKIADTAYRVLLNTLSQG